jgi:hypothetical protein
MEDQECLAIFDSIPEDIRERAEYVDQHAPECACEVHSVSPHSDEAVQEEELLRLVIDDTHVERDGDEVKLKSIFMQDSVTIGSSTLRIGKATKQEISELIAELTEGKTKKTDGSPVVVIGYLRIPSSWVREREFVAHYDTENNELLSADDAKKKSQTKQVAKRAHAIYATGLEYRPSHAEIFGCNFKFLTSKSQRNRQAKTLGEKVTSRFVRVDNIDEILTLGLD